LAFSLCIWWLRVIIVEAEAAKKSEEAILKAHRIPSPMSPDLVCELEGDMLATQQQSGG
jgi:hypothetical protein